MIGDINRLIDSWRKTESHERRLCADELEKLMAAAQDKELNNECPEDGLEESQEDATMGLSMRDYPYPHVFSIRPELCGVAIADKYTGDDSGRRPSFLKYLLAYIPRP